MSLRTEIANLAISHLGQGKDISNIDSERSSEAATMRRYFPIVSEIALKDFPYTFANITAALNLVEESPNDEWAYAYRYPTDCLTPIRILSGQRTDNQDTYVAYKIGKDSSGKLIYTDKQAAELEYTQMITDTSRFPADFVMAISFLLAAMAAPRLLGEDPFKMGEKAMNMYMRFKGQADSSDANARQPDKIPEAESIRARE
jgi:hypothetical protein